MMRQYLQSRNHFFRLRFQLKASTFAKLLSTGAIQKTTQVIKNGVRAPTPFFVTLKSGKTVRVSKTGHGWYEIVMKRRALFRESCPSYLALKGIAACIARQSVPGEQPGPVVDVPVVHRKIRVVRNGVVAKPQLTMADAMAAGFESMAREAKPKPVAVATTPTAAAARMAPPVDPSKLNQLLNRFSR